MDYRSPFEIKQSIKEEFEAAAAGVKRGSKKTATSSGGASSTTGPTPPVVATTSSSSADKNDPTALERELPQADSLKALAATMQHEEEVQRHVESGNLAPNEVALYLMANGSTGQKISMFQHLYKSAKEIESKKMTQLIHTLCESMWVQEPELQCVAPAGLIALLPLVPTVHATQMLEGAKAMLEVRMLEVREAWSSLVVACISYMLAADILNIAVPLALKKCEYAEPQDQRVLGCQMIGKICGRVDADAVLNTVVPRALSLCQDTSVAVRCAMCAQLTEVAKAIGLKNAKEKLSPELFELLSDEEKLVSRAAFSCLIDLIEFFDAAYRREHLYPIIKSYISSPPEDVLSLLIEEFGRFLWKIKTDIQSNDDVVLFATFFKQCSHKSDPEVRRMCAFNLPAVVASLPPAAFSAHLHASCRSLASDSAVTVRRCVAAGFHELMNLLGDRAAQWLSDIFQSLMQDHSLEVRSILMKNCRAMLKTFAAQLKGEDRDSFFLNLVPSFLSYESQTQKDWRKTTVLLDSFAKFPEYYQGQVLYEKFNPVLFRLLKDGVWTIKDQCADLLMLFTSHIRNVPQAVEIFARVSTEYGKGVSCYQRANYLRLFCSATQYYSRRFIRERMVETVFELTKDPVVSVRASSAKALLNVRKAIKGSSDAATASALQDALQRLQMDDDELVRNCARDSADAIDTMEREAQKNNTASSKTTPLSAEDVQDRKREETEGGLVDAAKEHEKNERRAKLKELLRAEREKEEATAPATGKGKGGPSPAGFGKRVPGSSSHSTPVPHHPAPSQTKPTSTLPASTGGLSRTSSSTAPKGSVHAISSSGGSSSSLRPSVARR